MTGNFHRISLEKLEAAKSTKLTLTTDFKKKFGEKIEFDLLRKLYLSQGKDLKFKTVR